MTVVESHWPAGTDVNWPDQGVVHVWYSPLARSRERRQQLWSLLAPDERARAQRFYFERDRNHYVVGRGVLRLLLGRYLDMAPDAMTFVYNEQGKPSLAGAVAGTGLSFNVSHSHGVALYAFGVGVEVGVDVEQIRITDDLERLAEYSFSKKEFAIFLSVPPAERGHAFFNCWTRKEAFIKAVGEGLSYPLHAFDVSLRPGDGARFELIKGSHDEAARWSLIDLDPLPGYAAAVAVYGTGWGAECCQWHDELGFSE